MPNVHVISTRVEHPSIVNPSRFLERLVAALAHARICRTEHARRTVLPNPGVDHPLRKCIETASLYGAVSLSKVRFDTAVGKDAQIGMAMPRRERLWEGRKVMSFADTDNPLKGKSAAGI
jgi:hypothetical protein